MKCCFISRLYTWLEPFWSVARILKDSYSLFFLFVFDICLLGWHWRGGLWCYWKSALASAKGHEWRCSHEQKINSSRATKPTFWYSTRLEWNGIPNKMERSISFALSVEVIERSPECMSEWHLFNFYFWSMYYTHDISCHFYSYEYPLCELLWKLYCDDVDFFSKPLFRCVWCVPAA